MNNHLLFCFFLLLSYTTFAQNCTDRQAKNFNPTALQNSGDCIYKSTKYKLTRMHKLSDTLQEGSGLLFFDGSLWTHGDSGGDNALYRIDSNTGEVLQVLKITNSKNVDWEDLAEDDTYIYIGDFGNNRGNRKDLTVYRIHKKDINQYTTSVKALRTDFVYSDQTDFTIKLHKNNYDCEAFVHKNGFLHLFSKNWVDGRTRHYVLDPRPGKKIAVLQDELDVNGMITGATIGTNKEIALIGYTKKGKTFMYLLFDYPDMQVFKGNKRRIKLGTVLRNSQAEGIAFDEDGSGYVIAEKFKFLAPKLFHFTSSQWTNEALRQPSTEWTRTITKVDWENGKLDIFFEIPQQYVEAVLYNSVGQIVHHYPPMTMEVKELNLQISNELPKDAYHFCIKTDRQVWHKLLLKNE